MKKTVTWFLLLIMLVNLTGCEAVAKKFRRKKKEPVKAPRIYQVKEYIKEPTPELYKKHFTYWASWHSELIQELGGNHKKDLLCIEQIVSNLKDMQNILVLEKGKDLTPHIERLIRVRDIIVKEDLSTANQTYVLHTLEREERFIKKEFVYKKVRDCLKKSFEDEPKN